MFKRIYVVIIALFIVSMPTQVLAVTANNSRNDEFFSKLNVDITALYGLMADSPRAAGLAGAGTEISPYLITSAADFAYMRDCVNASGVINGGEVSVAARTAFYKLTKDIDISEYASWIPVGATQANCFAGCFDGGGRTVSGLEITSAASAYNALFGCIDGGTIKNLTVSGTVTGDSVLCSADVRFGGIAAYISNGKIDNCTANVAVIAVYNSDKNIYVGGVAAYINENSFVTGCVNKGALAIEGNAALTGGGMIYIGGITGNADVNTSKIDRCQNSGALTVSNAVRETARFAGGIAGRTAASLGDCENRGDIMLAAMDGYQAYAGGIAGYIINAPEVVNCNAAADITVTVGPKNIGGITGYLRNATLDNCCFSGDINNATTLPTPDINNTIGGITGCLGAATVIKNCYFKAQSGIFAVNYASKTGAVFDNIAAFSDTSGVLAAVRYADGVTTTTTSVSSPVYADLLTALNSRRGSHFEWLQTAGAYPTLFAATAPEPSPSPTVEHNEGAVYIYGNGLYIWISGDSATTVIEWSATADGSKTTLGSYSDAVYVYGGGADDVSGDTYITMTGGTAALLCGSGTTGTVGGTAYITVEGGSAGLVLGGADASVISVSGGLAGTISGAAVNLSGAPFITAGIDLSAATGNCIYITGKLTNSSPIPLINAPKTHGAVLGRASSEAFIEASAFTAYASDGTALTIVKNESDIVVAAEESVSVSVSVSGDHISISPDTATCGVDWNGVLTADIGYLFPAVINISVGDVTLPAEAYTYSALTGAITVFSAYITSDIVVTAQSLAATNKIIFDSCGGIGGSGSVDAAYSAAMPTIELPSRVGYFFSGYYDAPIAGVLYYNSDGTSARAWDKLGDGTLYARWTLLIPAAPSLTGLNPAALTYGYIAPPALTVGLADADALNFDYAYAWYYSDAAGSGAIPGASAPIYTVPADLNAGEHYYTVRVTVSNKAGGEAAYGDYTFTVTVEPKIVMAELFASDKVYDGTADAVGVITLTGVLDGDDVSAVGHIAFDDANAGTDKSVSATSLILTGTSAVNYALASDTSAAAANITPMEVTLVWSGADTRVYDARPSLVTASAVIPLASDRCSVNVSGGDAVDAGTHTASAVLDNANYMIKGGDTKEYSITPAILTATYPGETVVFMDEPPTLAVSVTGFVGGETAATAKGYTAPVIVPLTEEQKTVGMHALTPTGGSAANYTFAMVPGTLTVAARDFDMVSVTGYDGEYDGNPHSVTFTDTNPDKNRAQITYYSDSTLTVPVEKPVFIHAGSYTIYYKITAAGTNALAGSASVTVRKKPVTASLTVEGKIYDGTVGAVGVIDLIGVIGNEDVTAEGRIEFDSPGVGAHKSVTAAEIVLIGASAENYSLTSNTAGATASIASREVALLWSGADERAYNGLPSRVTATASGVLDGDECGVNVSGGDQIIPGSYTATALSLTNANYSLPNFGASRMYIITAGAIGGIAATPYIGVTDGKNHPIITALTGTLPGDGVYFSTDGGANWSDAVPTVSAPGVYAVLVKITRSYCCDCYIGVNAVVSESPQQADTYLAIINYMVSTKQTNHDQTPAASDFIAPSEDISGTSKEAFDDTSDTAPMYGSAGVQTLSTGVSRLLETKAHISYITGDADGRFEPDRALTRAEAAQMFYNLLSYKNVAADTVFADVPDSSWCARAIKSLCSLGILHGVGDGIFHPNDYITREQFCAIAVRFAAADGAFESPFADVGKARWSHDSIAAAASFGWIKGYDDGTFRPAEVMTRAQAVAVINRMLGRSADAAFVEANADKLTLFADVRDKSRWYYYDIAEASIHHTFTMSGGDEIWRSIK